MLLERRYTTLSLAAMRVSEIASEIREVNVVLYAEFALKNEKEQHDLVPLFGYPIFLYFQHSIFHQVINYYKLVFI